MIQLKVQKIGDQTGIVLDEEALAVLGVAEGDSVFVSDLAKSSERDVQLEIARKVMVQYDETLRELAK